MMCPFLANLKILTIFQFSKIDVNGASAHPLFEFLKAKQGGLLGNFIKWNFTKFVINKNGVPVSMLLNFCLSH